MLHKNKNGEWEKIELPSSAAPSREMRVLLDRIRELEGIIADLELSISALLKYVEGE